MNIFVRHKTALIIAIAVGVYLKYLLIPTGMLFFELYHATGIEFVYSGYTIFKGGGYYFSVWEYQTVTCVAVALAIFGFAVMRGIWADKGEKGS